MRKILIKLEEKADSTSWLESTDIKGYDSRTVTYHCSLLFPNLKTNINQ
ncbi:hypothetical protein [Rodentibacter ratti]|nr:hypothetical protein [Rodentibacter ratti]